MVPGENRTFYNEEDTPPKRYQSTVNQPCYVNHLANRQPEPWAFFDKIYCISLKTRPDRRAQAARQFAEAGLLHRVEFVVVARHPEDREEGIFQSHLQCLSKGLRDNGQHILVFEDDVFFQELDPRALREACNHLETTSDWQALFLGCITDGSTRIDHTPLAKITYRCLAHAYALNRPFAEDIARQPWSGIPFDELLRRRQTNFYALYPMCAFQGRAGSDNQTVVIDRLRRLCGGLPFIQKMNEMYQNHKTALLPATLAAVLLLALLTFKLW